MFVIEEPVVRACCKCVKVCKSPIYFCAGFDYHFSVTHPLELRLSFSWQHLHPARVRFFFCIGALHATGISKKQTKNRTGPPLQWLMLLWLIWRFAYSIWSICVGYFAFVSTGTLLSMRCASGVLLEANLSRTPSSKPTAASDSVLSRALRHLSRTLLRPLVEVRQSSGTLRAQKEYDCTKIMFK